MLRPKLFYHGLLWYKPTFSNVMCGLHMGAQGKEPSHCHEHLTHTQRLINHPRRRVIKNCHNFAFMDNHISIIFFIFSIFCLWVGRLWTRFPASGEWMTNCKIGEPFTYLNRLSTMLNQLTNIMHELWMMSCFPTWKFETSFDNPSSLR